MQFGKVTKVRVSRSKKTARAKGYAFLEFASAEVAKIAAGALLFQSQACYWLNGLEQPNHYSCSWFLFLMYLFWPPHTSPPRL